MNSPCRNRVVHYAHEFSRREHGERARVALEAAYTEMVAARRR
jgi:hypothetical protein